MSVLLIHGENEYQVEARLIELRSNFLLENNSESMRVFDGEDCDSSEVVQAFESQSLFSHGQEMIIVKRLGSNTQLKERLTEFVEKIPKGTSLIIYDPRIDKRSKLYKTLKKANATQEYTPLTEHELVRWLSSEAKSKNSVISSRAARMLIERTKGDQIAISNELAKLISFSRDIDEYAVANLVELAPDDNVFELLDSLTSGDKTRALNKYEELRQAQMEAHYILVMISWQLGNMLIIKLAESKPEHQIASDTGINPYTIRKTRDLTGRLNKVRIKKMLQMVVDTDKKLKTTSVDADQLIKNLIAKL